MRKTMSLTVALCPKNGSSSRVTMKQRIGAGFLVATQLEVRIAVKVAFIHAFNEPPDEEWPRVVGVLVNHFEYSIQFRKLSRDQIVAST
jgi:hypothetical protein